MLNKFSKLILLFSAYLPLLWIIAIYHFPTIISLGPPGEFILWSILIFSIVILVLIKLLLRTINKVKPVKIDIEISESKNTEIIAFFVSYLYALMPSRFDIYSILALAIVFIFIAYIYLTTDMIAINPILNFIFRYNIYIGVFNQEKILILSKKKYMPKNYHIIINKLQYDIFIEKNLKRDAKNEPKTNS